MLSIQRPSEGAFSKKNNFDATANKIERWHDELLAAYCLGLLLLNQTSIDNSMQRRGGGGADAPGHRPEGGAKITFSPRFLSVR